MSRSTLLIVLFVAVVLAGAVIFAQTSPDVPVSSESGTRIDAPGTRVETDSSGTRVQAPGVDITVPKSQGKGRE